MESAANCPAFLCDNAAIFAAALSPGYVVNTTADTSDGTCDLSNCTLREAIAAANGDGVPSAIGFDIPGDPGPITLGSALPTITAPVTLDGFTQPTRRPTPRPRERMAPRM